MTIGIPGGHFFLSPLHPSPLHPSPFQSRLLSVIPDFSPSFLTSLIVIPGSTGNPFQKSSKPFKKRKISDWVLLKAHIILKFVA